jgi:type I restriction enzyme R subunit
MKAIMPHAVFIGFTSTPLLAQDRQTSREIFGNYIHTYKFNEGVEDKIVLDLVYEARDIEQSLSSEDPVIQWFDAKTSGLNAWQKAALREKWGTMQNVLSSQSRMDKVVANIVLDFAVKPRLANQRGTAMLVASSIYEACRYFDLFQKTPFKGKCAVITSYDPHASDISLEDTGENTDTAKEYIYKTYTDLIKDVVPHPSMSKTETYEQRAKDLFKDHLAEMQLLVAVDKLLVGHAASKAKSPGLARRRNSATRGASLKALRRAFRLAGTGTPLASNNSCSRNRIPRIAPVFSFLRSS